MKKFIIICLILTSCKKEVLITINDNPTSIVNPEKTLFDINISEIYINHPKKKDIYDGLDITFYGTVNFINDNGNESMILTPSIQKSPSPWIKLPTIQLVKRNGKFMITNFYDNINFGMGGRECVKFGTNAYVWADTGPELDNNTTFPYNQIYLAQNITDSTIKWIQVSTDKSFYHSLSVGDLNHDGYLDVASIHAGTYGPVPDRIHTFINNGDNTFTQKKIIMPSASTGCAYDTSQQSIGFPKCPSWSASSIIVDKIDNNNGLVILKADGVHFTTDIVKHSFEVYSDPTNIGKYDVLKFNQVSGIYLKSPDMGPTRMKLYDYDNDGKKDIIAMFQQNTSTSSVYDAIQIFHNDGNGSFSSTDKIIEFPSSNFIPGEFDLLDANGDGLPDIVVDAQKNHFKSDNVFQYSTSDPINLNADATIDFDQLIYYNNGNGNFAKRNMGFKHKFEHGTGIQWVRGFIIEGKFKFVCLQKYGDYLNQSSYVQKIIELYPKF